MLKPWKYVAIGACSMFIFLVSGYMIFLEADNRLTPPPNKLESSTTPSDAVIIKHLPPLLIMRGTNVPFEGKVELPQAIAGRFAQDIVITNFQATGDNAEKSIIKIVWENGEVENVYPATKDKHFSADKRALEISIVGYSMHERRIFKDSSRKGTLTWEIRYEPVE
ncbi:hypothetical protein SDC9_05904 [bioreactor metagenome]|uniref:Uncharacterized protein n=1 Tax=bioreactor metagenome TaxID=1076179 RepID=A0A644T0C2_9ZZZZ|nr:hypothetical protein [Negativicutes bacterium]